MHCKPSPMGGEGTIRHTRAVLGTVGENGFVRAHSSHATCMVDTCGSVLLHLMGDCHPPGNVGHAKKLISERALTSNVNLRWKPALPILP